MRRSSLHANFGSATVTFALIVLTASAAAAGNDFLVNDTTAGNQHYQDAAMDDAGGFLIAWTSNPTWQQASVLGKRYDSNGDVIRDEYPITDSVAGEQQLVPRLCHRDGGGWAVIWRNVHTYGISSVPFDETREGVFARFLAEDGTPVGTAFQVSTPDPSTQGLQLDIACLPGGGFFAAWGSSDQDGSGYGVFGRYVDGAGNLVGTEIQVNTDTDGAQGNFGGVSVASSPAGKVLAMWSSGCPAYMSGPDCLVEPDGSASSAQARLFDESGTPMGPEFRVNTTTLGNQGTYGVAAAFDSNENFMVVFTSGDTDDLSLCNNGAPCSDLLAQRYDATGKPVGDEISVNSTIPGNQIFPDVAYDGNGGYLVVWQSRPPYTDDAIDAVAGRHFDADGVPSGSDFLVTSNEPRDDRDPRIASLDGNYVVAWTNFDRASGWKRSVHARRLSSELPICPAIPAGDCAKPDDSVISMRDGGTIPSKLAWNWSAARSTASLAPNGGMTGYSLCIYDTTGVLIAKAGATPFAQCGEKICWHGRNGRYRFKKRNGEAFQVRTLSVRNGRGRTKIRLKAAGSGLVMPRMHDMSAPLTAQLFTSDGACWEADYNALSMRTHSLAARSHPR